MQGVQKSQHSLPFPQNVMSYTANEFFAGSTHEHMHLLQQQVTFGTDDFHTQVMASFCFETFHSKI
jgi:hypothetical protein